MKRAQLIAEAVAVLCPFCGDAQPNQGGSEMWTLEDFRVRAIDRSTTRLKNDLPAYFTCVSCDARFILASDTKVMFR